MKFLIQHFIAETFHSRANSLAIEQGPQTFSYAQVDHLANQFAHHFKSLGLKKGDHIGVLSRVRFETIAAIIGALRCGIIYIPLNIHAPAKWVSNVVEAANIKHIIVDPAFSDRVVELSIPKFTTTLNNNSTESFNLSHILRQQTNPIIEESILADDIAYILYTSGSTGNPKGIMLTHRNAFTFIEWMREEFKVNPTDRIFSRAPLQFDLSVFDIFTTFAAGATLVIADLESEHSPEDVVTLLREKKISIIYTVPSAYIAYLTKGNLERGVPTLRALLYAGEPFPTPYLRRVMQCLPGTIVSNIYGPTETNIVTYHHLDKCPENDDPIPIGKPVFDTQAYIVDENLLPVPVGTVGEILIRGGTVFVGYFNDSELTRKKLIQSPFHNYPTLLCRTGDFGRFLPNGDIAYHGRMDNMVKTRGYRVEIGDVEAAISAFSLVNEVAVIAKPHEKYGHTLHAFVACARDSFSIDDLKGFVTNQLPNYMVPYEFIQFEQLPKTATGKVDRVKLKDFLIK